MMVPDWLIQGEITGMGRVPAGSNATFALAIRDGDTEHLAIYKPRAGERPLWDFPSGTLYQREVATYLVSESLGWNLVPPTVVREGPHGIGSVQVYVEPDEKQDYWHVRKERRDDLIKIALFDIVTNNADRKGEHCHLASDGRFHCIDNGLTFHAEFKNRTVLADFAGNPIPAELSESLKQVSTDPQRRNELTELLAPLLADDEIEEFLNRVDQMARARKMPRVYPHWEMHYVWDE